MASVSNYGYIERMEDKQYSNVKRGGYTYFAENDIIIAKITPCMENGKCAIATGLTNGIGFGSTEFHVLRCKEQIINKYLFGYLNRSAIREEAAKRMTGASGHRRVPIEFYEDLKIPVLPMAEQQQIISQVEQYEAEIRKAQAIMDDCPVRKKAILDKYLN
jgi:restriction endonuclease S subunit